MQIEFDFRVKQPNELGTPFKGIRLYPETNSEIPQLLDMIKNMRVVEIKGISNPGSWHALLRLEDK